MVGSTWCLISVLLAVLFFVPPIAMWVTVDPDSAWLRFFTVIACVFTGVGGGALGVAQAAFFLAKLGGWKLHHKHSHFGDAEGVARVVSMLEHVRKQVTTASIVRARMESQSSPAF